MQVEAVFQFYLPYELPRTDDWKRAGLLLEGPEFVADVRPRGAGEALFPTDIDTKLSELTLEGDKAPVRVGCWDRIEVRVWREVASDDELQREETTQRFLGAATRACDQFLYLCRVGLRHPFIKPLERAYVFEEDEVRILAPYSVTWVAAEDGRYLNAYGEGAYARCFAEKRRPIRGSISMSRIAERAEAGELPSLARSLLVDAEEGIVVGHLREAVLGLAIGCEVASNEYVRGKGMEKDPTVREILSEEDISFAERRFHRLPEHVSERSLKKEDPDAFRLVQNMYRARNEIMHKGLLRYREERSWIAVDERVGASFLGACWTAVDWLADL